MADVIRIKRRLAGGAAGAPATLANAELAYNEQDHTLYIGEGTGGAGGSATVIRAIAGDVFGGNYQPLDPDLTSLAAASGTNVLYYRSAANTWATVTIGSGLTFTAGTLAASGGGGNVSNSGTPVNGQLAQWINANQIAGVSTGLITISAFGVPTLDVPYAGFKITGLGDPTGAQDAATKNYVDNIASGIDAKASVKAMTNGNITLSGTQTIDGVALIAGDRVLVVNQTPNTANGVYVVAAGAWARATDLDTWNELVSAYVWVEQGVSFVDTGWLCTVDAGGTLGTTPISWVQFSGAGQITAGGGLVKTGNVIDAVGTSNRISVAADSIDISAAYVGQTSITTLGTVTTGVWQGTAIAQAYIAGLGTMASQNANAVAITGGTIDGVTLDGGTF